MEKYKLNVTLRMEEWIKSSINFESDLTEEELKSEVEGGYLNDEIYEYICGETKDGGFLEKPDDMFLPHNSRDYIFSESRYPQVKVSNKSEEELIGLGFPIDPDNPTHSQRSIKFTKKDMEMETNKTNETQITCLVDNQKIFLIKQYKNWEERFSPDCVMREVFVKVNKDVTKDDFYNECLEEFFKDYFFDKNELPEERWTSGDFVVGEKTDQIMEPEKFSQYPHVDFIDVSINEDGTIKNKNPVVG